MTLKLTGVSFSYPGTATLAVDSITAAFGPGSVTLVTGSLGSGCSTLLLLAAGLAPHVTGGKRSGVVSVLDRDPADPGERRAVSGEIGLLLSTPWTQLSGIAPTVADEVAFGPANHGWELSRIVQSVERAMDRVGVAHLRDRDPLTLSGGELQRVILAAIMAMEPMVYLLDEPALELDPAAAEELYNLLPELAREATVIVASTDVDRLAGIAGRVLLLRSGACIADGPPEQVLATELAVSAHASTTVAEIARAAGMSPPYPLTVAAVNGRLGR